MGEFTLTEPSWETNFLWTPDMYDSTVFVCTYDPTKTTTRSKDDPRVYGEWYSFMDTIDRIDPTKSNTCIITQSIDQATKYFESSEDVKYYEDALEEFREEIETNPNARVAIFNISCIDALLETVFELCKDSKNVKCHARIFIERLVNEDHIHINDREDFN